MDHRLKIAGATYEIFDPDAKRIIYDKSSGIPRVINSMSDMALLMGFNERKKNIDAVFIEKVLKSMEWSSNGSIY